MSETNCDPNIQIEHELSKYTFKSIINELNEQKAIFVHAIKKVNDNEEQDAIIIFEKSHFNVDDVKGIINNNYEAKIDLVNDIYIKFCVYPLKPHNSVQVQLICPATQAHFIKYAKQEHFLINETYEDYLKHTIEFINKSALTLQWVYNILDHKKESERIIYEDPEEKNGFILLPDMKWDGNLENLYLLAIVRQRGIRSIRDLDQTHVGLIENVYKKGLDAIKSKFNLNPSKIRVFFHYLPSFYHLHVHFTHIKFEQSGGTNVERAHLVTSVIENLKLCSDYYKKVTLTYKIRMNDDLYKSYQERC